MIWHRCRRVGFGHLCRVAVSIEQWMYKIAHDRGSSPCSAMSGKSHGMALTIPSGPHCTAQSCLDERLFRCPVERILAQSGGLPC